MLELTDEQIDEAAFRMAMEDTREGLRGDRGSRRPPPVRTFGEALDLARALWDLEEETSTLTRAWEAASGEGQVVS